MTAGGFIQPDWPAPARVGTLVTTRSGGISPPPYDSLNLAAHVGDSPQAVISNRTFLKNAVAESLTWQWLQQVHGNEVLKLQSAEEERVGDALVTTTPGLVCCVLTADCLPVLFCNEDGDEIAIAHGGWRGLAGGLLSNTLQALGSAPESLLVWLGAAIGPCHFEVGPEVREQFLATDDSLAMSSQFHAQSDGKFLADLYGIARTQLQQHGIEQIFGGGQCTFCDSERFYSYRRDGHCGRMLSAIYLRH